MTNCLTGFEPARIYKSPRSSLTDGIFICEFQPFTEDRFAVDARGLAEWLCDEMRIATRVVVLPTESAFDAATAHWGAEGFAAFRNRAENDRLPTELVQMASASTRVFIASSPNRLANWAEALLGETIMVCCLRSAMELPPETRRRSTAIYHHLGRYCAGLGPSISHAA